MDERHRFLATVTAGTLPFPGPLVSVTESLLESRANSRPGPSRAPNRRRALGHFVLEISSTGITAKRFSTGAELVYTGLIVAGMLGGLGVFIALTTFFGLRGETTPFVVSLGLILLIPGGIIPGAFVGRGILKLWPQSGGVDLRISSMGLGTLWDVLRLVSLRGPLEVRVVSWRDRLEKALRQTSQMPPTDRVVLEGFRT